MVGEGCCGWLCRMVSSRRAGGLMIFPGGVGCIIKILMGVVDVGSSERCLSG